MEVSSRLQYYNHSKRSVNVMNREQVSVYRVFTECKERVRVW